MASIADMAREIDRIDEPDKVLRLHAIAKVISDSFAPGYRPNFNEYPEPDEPAFKPGDRAWVEVEVAEDVEDDGEVMVFVPRRDDISAGFTAVYALASALRPAPPAAEGVGE